MTTSIIQAAVAIGDKSDSRIPTLVADLANRKPAVRMKARKALVKIGKCSVPALVRLLSHRKAHVRWEAANGLCDIADPIAASALVNALDDRDSDVRWRAAEGLAVLGRDGLEPLLAALLERAQFCWFCEGAHHVCHTLVGKKGLGPILQPLLEALSESEPAVSAPPAAYTALSKLRKSS